MAPINIECYVQGIKVSGNQLESTKWKGVNLFGTYLEKIRSQVLDLLYVGGSGNK